LHIKKEVRRSWGQEREVKECLIIESGQAGFKIGFQGTTVGGKGARVKLYVSEAFECNMHNTEEGMTGQARGKFVYRRSLGNVCRTQNNGGANVSPLIPEPAIKKVAQVWNREMAGRIHFR
jgi:hypothetical protein